MARHDSDIFDFLALNLSESELSDYAKDLKSNQSLIESVLELLEDRYRETEILEPVCNQLLQVYRHPDPQLRLFVLQFMPVVVGTYLLAISQRLRKLCGPLEALLLGIYNLEILEQKPGTLKAQKVRIPSLASASIYHDPANLSSLGLTDSALLNGLGNKNPYVIEIGPYPSITKLNAQNRFLVLTLILRIYNAYQSDMSAESAASLCRMTSRICCAGFTFPAEELARRVFGDEFKEMKKRQSHFFDFARSSDIANAARVQIHPSFLLELLNGIYYVMFNDFPLPGIKAVEDINFRAQYDLYADVLMVSQSIINSLVENPSGQPCDGPMGLRVASVSAKAPGKSKMGFVTNASLRIKKVLSEDIPIRTDTEDLKNTATSPLSGGKSQRHIKGTLGGIGDMIKARRDQHRQDHLRGSYAAESSNGLKPSRSASSFSNLLDGDTAEIDGVTSSEHHDHDRSDNNDDSGIHMTYGHNSAPALKLNAEKARTGFVDAGDGSSGNVHISVHSPLLLQMTRIPSTRQSDSTNNSNHAQPQRNGNVALARMESDTYDESTTPIRTLGTFNNRDTVDEDVITIKNRDNSKSKPNSHYSVAFKIPPTSEPNKEGIFAKPNAPRPPPAASQYTYSIGENMFEDEESTSAPSRPTSQKPVSPTESAAPPNGQNVPDRQLSNQSNTISSSSNISVSLGSQNLSKYPYSTQLSSTSSIFGGPAKILQTPSVDGSNSVDRYRGVALNDINAELIDATDESDNDANYANSKAPLLINSKNDMKAYSSNVSVTSSSAASSVAHSGSNSSYNSALSRRAVHLPDPDMKTVYATRVRVDSVVKVDGENVNRAVVSVAGPGDSGLERSEVGCKDGRDSSRNMVVTVNPRETSI